eukprot:scaffold239202_cov15-Prasinocladus_malaysianus.AAC.1
MVSTGAEVACHLQLPRPWDDLRSISAALPTLTKFKTKPASTYIYPWSEEAQKVCRILSDLEFLKDCLQTMQASYRHIMMGSASAILESLKASQN